MPEIGPIDSTTPKPCINNKTFLNKKLTEKFAG